METIVSESKRNEGVQETYPLSPLQQGMLFHHLMNETRDTYVLSALFEIQSPPLVDDLVAAIQKVIDRHDLLRCAVLWDGLPHPMHVVYRQANLLVRRIMLDQGCDPRDSVDELMRPNSRSMDLQEAPLVRLYVVSQEGESRCHAVLQVHHIICDHQSLRMIIDEVMAFMGGSEHLLPQPVSFREFVTQTLTSESDANPEAFFRSKLEDVEEPSAPFGLLDVHGNGGQITEASRELQSTLTERIRIQARRAGVSAARLFHAAWGLVVAHTSGRGDVVFGTVLLTSRCRREQTRPLGMAVNTLPLRLRMHDVTAVGLVELTQRHLTELLDYAQTSLIDAQRCSGIGPGMPLFTSLLNFRHSASARTNESATTSGVRLLSRADAWTNYPITLTVDDFGNRFLLTAHTDPRIDPLRLSAYLETAIESLVHALEFTPERPALSLTVLPETERQQVLGLFNETQADFSRERRIHRLFEEQVRRTPDARALEYRDVSYTYSELNRIANRLARYLISRGVKPDQPVAVWVERTPEMIVALIAILKSGAGYLPLDPSYPPERIRSMLQDAAPPIVFSEKALTASLPMQGELVLLSDVLRELSGFGDQDLAEYEADVTPENLLYVIYTSGSTGKPKGIVMPHRAMANLIEWHRECFDRRDRPVTLQFAALSFDVAFQEIFSTLCIGGTLVLLDEDIRKDAAALSVLLREHQVETLFLPPLMLQNLAQHFTVAGSLPECLSNIVVAGEQLRITPEIASFVEQLKGCRLHNHYGPTETHVVTAMTLSGDPRRWPTFPSIGRPIANTQIYILDEHRRPVPVDVAGEIYIGGANVSRGYLNQPELTAERFVCNPFRSEAGGCMYKTGDQGRWHANGTIEFLGRKDDQVKIRGYRIELKEIESQLAKHEQVREAVVVLRNDVGDEKTLVAYVTAGHGNRPAAEQLRSHLKALLPEYMVPTAFVVMDRFPITPSGKLSRRALPLPQRDDYALQCYEPPQGETEQLIADIWLQLLRAQRVGRQDNFLDLGGHSLLAMQVVTRIQSALSVQVPVRLLFESPTVQQLSARVDELRRASLLDRIDTGGAKMEELLQAVASMPASMVTQLRKKLQAEGKR